MVFFVALLVHALLAGALYALLALAFVVVYVVISGTATCNDQDIWDEARRIIARYRAPHEVDDYVARWKTEPRVLITVTPEHIATRAPR